VAIPVEVAETEAEAEYRPGIPAIPIIVRVGSRHIVRLLDDIRPLDDDRPARLGERQARARHPALLTMHCDEIPAAVTVLYDHFLTAAHFPDDRVVRPRACPEVGRAGLCISD
jgi:hypothetical protein